jgi:GH25 family lysozyme M1 (1,4-beta-N-acetylmuramidase)
MATEQEGIDTAWPQGARYNWGSWEGRIAFGSCKATQGTSIIDPDLGDNWDAMWALNDHRLPRFAYHEFRGDTDPAAQARYLIAAVKPHGLLEGDNFALVLSDNIGAALPPWQFAQRAAACAQAVNDLTGHRVLIYTDPYFASLGNCAGLNKWALWIANYGVLAPQIPSPWDNWLFWQDGDTVVDTDKFNGTAAELLAWARMPAKR